MAELETSAEAERLRRWRLVLGQDAEEGLGMCKGGNGASGGGALSGRDLGMDKALGALYDSGSERSGGLGSSSPRVARWLGDIRNYFSSSTVRIMQQDAFERLNLKQMLLEPEMLEQVDADVHLVTTLLSLNKIIPSQTKETARQVVRKVVEELEKKLATSMVQAIRGALNKAQHTYRPRFNEIDWDRTIRLNLKNYQPEQGTIIVERLVGHEHKQKKRSSLQDIVLCVDQSGSMASSVVYSSVFGAVLATLKAVSTSMVVFDTSVVDLTKDLEDPVDLLFGTQLGGGTDINQALGYCQQIITRPAQTILVLITDLYEGGNTRGMLRRAAELVQSGVQVICLLALSDDGAPSFDRGNAAALAQMGILSFACTPDKFPDLMAAAIQRQDLSMWAAKNDIVTARGKE